MFYIIQYIEWILQLIEFIVNLIIVIFYLMIYKTKICGDVVILYDWLHVWFI